MKRCLVLGPNSIIAKHFIRKLKSEGYEVSILTSCRGANWVYDFDSIQNRINEFRPRIVINFVGTSIDNNYYRCYKINVMVTKNLFDATISSKYKGKIILIGSAAEYGIQKKYNENCVEKPRSVYGLTKLMQHSLFQYYVSVYNMDACYIRIFNVCGTNFGKELFIGNFAQQIKSILKGDRNEIKLGNLKSYRDYLWIDDIYTGILKVIKDGKSGEVYNLGMGEAIFLEEFVRKVLLELDLKIKINLKKVNSRGNIKDLVVADINKINNIGWFPKYNYECLIKKFCRKIKEEISNKII